MTHDVIVVLAVFSIFWGISFTMEIDQAFIAAILTVIGYSINDTVVVFDRIREYVGLYGSKKSDEELMNSALNSTLSRTINTSLDVCRIAHHLLVGRQHQRIRVCLDDRCHRRYLQLIFIATPSVLDFSKRLTS